jgi:hypothetical protein
MHVVTTVKGCSMHASGTSRDAAAEKHAGSSVAIESRRHSSVWHSSVCTQGALSNSLTSFSLSAYFPSPLFIPLSPPPSQAADYKRGAIRPGDLKPCVSKLVVSYLDKIIAHYGANKECAAADKSIEFYINSTRRAEERPPRWGKLKHFELWSSSCAFCAF